jgi:hypothetical protein
VSVTVLGLVLSLGVEDVDAIQEAIEFTQSWLVLLMVLWPLHSNDEMVHFRLLIVAQRDSPFFWTTLARSQLTPGRAHIARMLLVNSQ